MPSGSSTDVVFVKPLPPARRWQAVALGLWEKDRRGTVEVATGGGKTFFAFMCFESARKLEPTLRLLVIVPTTALLDQWYVAIQEDLGIPDSDIKVLRSQDLVPDHPFNLVVINSARAFDSVIPGADEVLLVVDECHRAGSPENSKAMASGCHGTLGLSATPYRDFDQGFEEHVRPIIGPVIYQYTVGDALKDGVLAPLRITAVEVPLLPEESARYEALSRRIARAIASDSADEAVESLLRQRARVYNSAHYRIPVGAALLRHNRGRRAMVFLESIDEAERMASLLDEDGHSAVLYHSKIGAKIRRDNLRAFRKGIFDVLIACRALDEGFNVPEAEIALIVAGTSSRRQRIQRIGRVLRPTADKGWGDVFILYATPVEEARLRELETSIGEDAAVQFKRADVG